MRSFFAVTLSFGLFLVLLGAGACRVQVATVAIKDGQSVAFLGDSITQFGASNPGGYVRLVTEGLRVNGIRVRSLPEGVQANTSRDMLARLSVVLAKKPDWLTLSCGVNDVWHGDKGVALEPYQANVTSILERSVKSGAKVMIFTATPINEDVNSEQNHKLAAYNAFLRDLAVRKGCPLADLNAVFLEAYRPRTARKGLLTLDGMHMNPRGDQLMATVILRTFGLNEAQLSKANAAWETIPDRWSVKLSFSGAPQFKSFYVVQPLTRAQYEKLETVAAAHPRTGTVAELLGRLFDGDVKALLKPNGAHENVEAIIAAGGEKKVLVQLQERLTFQVSGLLKTTR